MWFSVALRPGVGVLCFLLQEEDAVVCCGVAGCEIGRCSDDGCGAQPTTMVGQAGRQAGKLGGWFEASAVQQQHKVWSRLIISTTPPSNQPSTPNPRVQTQSPLQPPIKPFAQTISKSPTPIDPIQHTLFPPPRTPARPTQQTHEDMHKHRVERQQSGEMQQHDESP